MSDQYRRIALMTVICALSACASLRGGGTQAALKNATIEVYRDADNNCQTNTSPYVRVKKGVDRNVEWKIVDRVGCTATAEVEVRFDKGDKDLLPKCNKKNRHKIECSLSAAETGRSNYSVWLGTSKEDPVLEIEQ